MKILRIISRIITGIVFIFSGTVKAIDPMGTVYKLQDYFHAFNLDFLSSLSLVAAIVLCTSEFIGGFSVLFNIRQKAGVWIVLIMMIIFTPLTFVLALTNPVSDCGCFGDAIHLTNWQTFFKNIVIIIPASYLFVTRKYIKPHQGITREWAILSIITVMFLAFIAYNLRYLPVVDFLPYKTGTHIPDKMIIPEGAPPDRYETTFIYEKNGEREEFTLDNYPFDDTTWKFVDQKSVLISKGYEPAIHDLTMVTPEGTDLTNKILSSEMPVLLMISRKLEEADPEYLMEGFDLGKWCGENSIEFYILTASGADQAARHRNGLNFCFTDEITLKTMVRSNPGYMILEKGTITGKWSWANVPEKEALQKIITTQ